MKFVNNLWKPLALWFAFLIFPSMMWGAGVTMSISDGTANEGAGTISFTVTHTGGTGLGAVDFTYSTSNGTAIASSDYTQKTNASGTIPAGTSSVVITIPLLNDTVVENTENFSVTIASSTTVSDGTGAGTIYDDDTYRFAISPTTLSTAEGNSGTTNAVYTVSISQAPISGSATVNYATVGVSATSDVDFTGVSGTLTFTTGTSQTITVPIKGDTIDEASETYTLTLSNPSSNASITTATGTGTITDDDSPPTLSISPVTLSTTEGNSGTTNATYTVTLSAVSANMVTVHYATAGGTATSGTDFTATSGDLTFAAGTTTLTQTITVPIKGDTAEEPNETYTVTLSSATNATIAAATATGTITNDDSVTLAISPTTVTTTEGNSGTTNATYTVTLSGTPASAVTVHYATAGGTATSGTDFTGTSGDFTFAAGTTTLTQTITVPIKGDTVDEPSETYTVTLSSPANATITTATATGTITDDDTITLSITPSALSTAEGNSGSTNATYTVTLSGTPASAVTVHYATANGTATAGSDYTSKSADLTFAAGTTTLTQTITVPILGDAVAEPNETYTVALSAAVNANISGTNPATGTILNDDTPTLAISPTTLSTTEGDSGTTNASYTVTLSTIPTSTVTVHYATAGGTATSGTDFTATSGDFTFAAGTTALTQTITVPIKGDTVDEPSETYTVTLSSPANATITTATATGTITDDDTITLSITPSALSTAEGNSGSTNATYTVTLSGTPASAVTVHYATANGTATAGSDYTSKSADLTFAAGTTTLTQTITVPILGDAVAEPNETYTVALSAAVNATITGTNPAVGTITNDDTPTLSINSVSQVERDTSVSNNMTFTVTLSAAQSTTVTVLYSTSNGTAIAGSDYTARTNQTITFNPGQTSRTFNIAITGDTVQEADETFNVTLSSPTGATIATGTGVGTILNDDFVTLAISPVTLSQAEGNSGTTYMNYTVTLSAKPYNNVTVHYATANGTATAGSDYTSTSGDFTFAAGTTTLTKTISVPIIGDTTPEADETYTVTLSAPTNATITVPTATGTILNDDTSISINDITIQEPPCFATTANLTVTLIRPVSYSVTVGYSTSNGTATAGSDYVAASGSITIPAGQTTGTIGITINPDALVEPNETFNVTITNGAGITITDNTGVVTITDNQNRDITMFPDRSVIEGDTGLTPMNFTVTLCFASANNVTLNYNTGGGTATEGTDYVSGDGGTVTIPAGSLTGTFAIQVKGDLIPEVPDETFNVTLSGAPANVTLNDPVAIGTIIDDDSRTISINDTTVTEGNTGTTTATLRISMTAIAGVPVTVAYSTQNGTATTADSDYVAKTGTVTIPAGSTYQDVTFSVNGDYKPEANEYFDVNISTTSGVPISDNRGRVTINDDDNRTLTLTGLTTLEGDNPTKDVNLTVTLNSSSPIARTITYSSVNGSAVAGSDFVAVTNQSVTIAAGTTSVNLPITIIGDLVNESNEAFTVTITSSDGFNISGSPATVNITNDDSRNLSINNSTVTEGNTGKTPATLTITMSEAAGIPVTVNFSTQNNSATTADLDYEANTSSVTFAAGETSKAVIFNVLGDYKVEGQEQFYVNISTTSGVTISDNQGYVRINDDDNRTLTLTGLTTLEGDNPTKDVNLTVTLNSSSPIARTITYSTVNGSAVAGSDFVAVTNQSVIIAAGTTSVNLPITIIGDLVNESNEAFTVTITSSDGFNISGSPATVDITNDDNRNLSINDTTVTEGNTGTTTATLRISMTAIAGVPVTVAYSTQNATATTADSDYAAKTGTVTIPAGSTYQDITFNVNGDYKPEANEYFDVNISTTSGMTVSDSSGRVTINDDDNRTLTLGGTLTFNEGNVNNDINLTVNVDVASPIDRTFYYYTTAGGATVWNGTTGDFIAVPSTAVTIPAGTTSVNLPITIIGDLVNEPSESFTVRITSSDGFNISGSPATVTITNDDGTLSIVPSVEQDESNTSQTATFPFVVTLTQASTSTIYVNYSTKDGTATVANNDYVAASGQLVFAPGDLTKTINVIVNGDITYEGQEYFDLNISNTQGVTITDDTSRGYIDDDDGRAISIDSLSVAEGDSGSKDQNLSVSISPSAGSDAVISYTITSSTATAGVDFAAASGTVTIPAGSLSVKIPVTYYGDVTNEPNENVLVTLSTSSSGFVIPSNVGTLTLVNDDGAVSIDDASVIEGNTGQKSVDVNLTVSDSPFDIDTTFNYTLQNGTANLSNNDYVAASGSVVLPAGETRVSIPVLIQSDTNSEPDEIFYVKITNDQNVTIADDTAAVTIVNDDSDAVGFVDEYQRDFAIRYRKNLYGDFQSTGAPVMCVVDSSGQCNWNYNGNLMDANTSFLNDVPSMGFNNSSSADLNVTMATGDKVLWAGLYWQGHIHSTNPTDIDTETGGFNQVKFRTPNGNEYDLTANAVSGSDAIGYYKFRTATAGSNLGYRMFYQGFVDVTSEVNQSLTTNPTLKTFSVAGIKSTPGVDTSIGDPSAAWGGLTYGNFGGWSLIVVVEKGDKSNPNDLHNVTISDGYKFLIAPPGGTKSIDINISGFKTPKSGTVDSKLLFFGGLGEKNIHGDKMEIMDKSGAYTVVSDVKNDANNPFNDTITVKGNDVNVTRIYNPGVDLDTVDISNNISHDQNKTTVRLSVSWIADATDPNFNGSTNVTDQTFAGVVGFSTQLYQPQLCYDYTFKQNGTYLKNTIIDLTEPPTLKGRINSAIIDTGIYLKNVESDFPIEGLSLFSDVNGSKLSYMQGTVRTTKVNGTVLTLQSESSGTGCEDYATGTASYIACRFAATEGTGQNVRFGLGTDTTGYTKNKAGYLGSGDFVYSQFVLDPIGISGDVNESLGLKLNYFINLGDGEIPYEFTLGENIKLCPPATGYTPSWGIFNVIDSANQVSGIASKNNLYTQVAKRGFNTDVAFYEKDGAGEYINPPSSETNTTVLVEIIDADSYHDINASCANPGASLTIEPVVVEMRAKFTDNTEAVTVQDNDYYNFAVKNGAFRVWYFDDGNGSLIQNWTANTSANNRTVNSISGLYQPGKHTSCDPAKVAAPNCSDSTSLDCYTCMKNNYMHPICSRDNFAIRPESYDIRIYDINQTDRSITQSLSLDNGYMTLATPNQLKLAAGYDYRFDLNATNHTYDLYATPGYTRYFSGPNNDYNATMYWDSTKTLVECNNIDSVPLTFNVIDGLMVDSNQSLNQAGEYLLKMIDKTWTAADWQSGEMGHHDPLKGFDSPSVSDCTIDDHNTLSSGSSVGCDISTDTHENGTLHYRDHTLKFMPYQFDISSTVFARGLTTQPLSTAAGARNFLYMANVSSDNDMNMSLRATGSIVAQGANGTAISNFVGGCYAQDVNLSMIHTKPDQNLTYQGRLIDTNTTYDSNATAIGATSYLFKLGEGNFTKGLNGSTPIVARFNYERNASKAMNPARIEFSEYQVKCSNVSQCQVSADGTSQKYPEGNISMGFGITHYYGRAQGIGSRIKPTEDNPAIAKGNIRLNFEVFCGNDGNSTCTNAQKALLPDGLNSVAGDDRDWYKNRDHNTSNDGMADDNNVLVQKNGIGDVTVTSTTVTGTNINSLGDQRGYQYFGVTYTGDKGYPYTTIMRNTPSSWLIYNKNNSNATLNEFTLEFYKPSVWVGQDKAGTSTDSDASVNPSRRIMW